MPLIFSQFLYFNLFLDYSVISHWIFLADIMWFLIFLGFIALYMHEHVCIVNYFLMSLKIVAHKHKYATENGTSARNRPVFIRSSTFGRQSTRVQVEAHLPCV